MSRTAVAWYLTVMAAQLCQRGGFHRSERLACEQPQAARLKRILFWHVYTMDKGLSLRLGQSSVIHDCDITIPRTFEFDGFGIGESPTIPTLWIQLSYVQGCVYEQLYLNKSTNLPFHWLTNLQCRYSPAALAQPQSELASRAEALAVQCREIEVETKTCEGTYSYLRSIGASELVDALRGDEIQLQVTLTLIYRAIPTPQGSVSQFCDECLQAARKAMTAHQGCAELMKAGRYDKLIYAHWSEQQAIPI